ncbi:uS2 family ribosomal protein, partial [Opitutales bacterium]|nr:uS2 family ribosomal protein [Opitutales bacterium]
IALVDSNSDPSLLSHPIPGNDDSTKSIRIIVDVILEAIQAGATKRTQTPTKRKDITPVSQEPDFLDNEDEPEVTLPEGYDEMDFDDRKKAEKTVEEEPQSETISVADNSSASVEESDSDSSKKAEANPDSADNAVAEESK